MCGKGNNGGDGLVAARLLREAGREVEVLLVWPDDPLSADATAMLERLPGRPPVPFDADRLSRAHVVVDALLGTGFSGAPREPVDRVIAGINAARARVIAADVPSGIDASTGEVAGEAVEALATATFHRAKPGLWIHPGKAHAGHVHVVDIGIPRGAPGGGPGRADRRRRHARLPAPRRRLDEVHLRERGRRRRLARHHRRADHGRPRRHARRRGLRHRRAPAPPTRPPSPSGRSRR